MAAKRKKKPRDDDFTWPALDDRTPLERLKREEAQPGLHVVIVETVFGGSHTQAGRIVEPNAAFLARTDRISKLLIQHGGVLIRTEEGRMLVVHHSCLELA